MPEVNGKKFPYDEQGLIAAEQERQGSPQPPQQGGGELEQYVELAKQLLQTPEVSKSLVKLGGNNKDAVEGMADMISMTVIKVDEKTGDAIPEEMVLPLTEQVVIMIEEMIAGTTGKPIPEKAVIKASQISVAKLMEHYGVSEEHIANALKGEDPEKVRAVKDETEKSMASKPQGQPPQGQPPQGVQR
jgi:hypothetical protein